jgi:hypothetical protein
MAIMMDSSTAETLEMLLRIFCRRTVLPVHVIKVTSLRKELRRRLQL